ncbi:MAG: hypothetical protein AB1631_34410, partial [Acidobacteriota bacterium]
MKRINIIARIVLAFALGISSPAVISRDESQTTKRREGEEVRRLGDLPYGEQYSCPYLQFINEREGWVAIGRKLFRTEDAGRHWEGIFDAGTDERGDSNSICDFQFINSKVGWVRMFDEMLRTEDGGKTWKPLLQPLEDKADRPVGSLRTFRFLEDGKRGWVAGGVYRSLEKHGEEVEIVPGRFWLPDDKDGLGLCAAVFYTEDGGKSWKEQPVTRTIGVIGGFYFLDAEHAWATGQAGMFYLEDSEWKATESGSVDEETGEYDIKCLEMAIGAPTYCPIEIFFLDSQSGWMSNSNGHLGRSTDGGKTWADILNPATVWE